ncbi:MAG: hypothetical protein IPG45_19040 [Deltaproteobacteria bacterium]|nr:hypothetical protein [Deltaproteobacteria bacterium]
MTNRHVGPQVLPRAMIGLVCVLAIGCGESKRTGSVRIVGPCREGETRSCSCTDGRMGAQICRAEAFEACICSGDIPDSGPVDGQPVDFGFGVDLGFWDGGDQTPDQGFFFPDATPPDFGFSDAGQADAFVPDFGFPDSGVRDVGFPDTGVRDVGFPDTGVRDVGFPPQDSGPSDVGPIPCNDDTQCALPAEICEFGFCTPGCFSTGAPCPGGEECSILTGRCGPPLGLCILDEMCNPPLTICELPLCVEGCITAGCPNGGSCNFSTGRCS